MKVWTAHLRPNTAPVLICEGFSPGAFLLGPIWLLAQSAFIPAALALAAELLAGLLTSGGSRIALELGIALLLGVSGRDLVRWHLDLRGYRVAHVLAASDEDTALARLLAVRPDLAGSFMPPGSA